MKIKTLSLVFSLLVIMAGCVTPESAVNDFRIQIYASITQNMRLARNLYPENLAVVIINVDYVNGTLTNIEMVQPSADAELNSAILDRLRSTRPPTPPSGLEDTLIPVPMRLCVSAVTKTCFDNTAKNWNDFKGLTYSVTP